MCSFESSLSEHVVSTTGRLWLIAKTALSYYYYIPRPRTKLPSAYTSSGGAVAEGTRCEQVTRGGVSICPIIAPGINHHRYRRFLYSFAAVQSHNMRRSFVKSICMYTRVKKNKKLKTTRTNCDGRRMGLRRWPAPRNVYDDAAAVAAHVNRSAAAEAVDDVFITARIYVRII